MSEDIAKKEYEIQFHGFTLEQFKIEHRLQIATTIKNLIKNVAEQGIENLSKTTLNLNPQQILDRINPLSDKILKSFERNLNDFDELVDKYFTIPNNCLIGEDELHNEDYTAEDEKYLKEKAAELEKALKQNVYMIHRANLELEKCYQLQDLLDDESDIAQKVNTCLNSKISLHEIESIIKVAEKKENSS